MSKLIVGTIVETPRGEAKLVVRASVCSVQFENGDFATYEEELIRPAVPRPGDRVRVVSKPNCSKLKDIGAELTVKEVFAEAATIGYGKWPQYIFEEDPGIAPYCRVAVLRRASPPAVSPEAPEQEWFGFRRGERVKHKSFPYLHRVVGDAETGCKAPKRKKAWQAPDALDRYAMHRRKLDQAKAQLGAKVEPRHPSDWDVSETEELRVT